MDTVNWLQILGEAVIAFRVALISLGKVWIQLFSLSQIIGQTGLFNVGIATSLGEGKLWIQTC